MITGVRFWDNREHMFVQSNNPTEEQLRKHGVGSWLETCGATAAVMCLAVLGWDLTIRCPGIYRPQPEEILADWLNDPRNYGELRKARPDWNPEAAPGNRVADYYPRAVAAVFAAHAEYIPQINLGGIVAEILAGRSVQLCLMPPGHYVAGVAYDHETEQIVYHDPWPGRKTEWHGNGFARQLLTAERVAVQPYAVVYQPPEGV